jgi:hypothetical protein
MARRRPTVVTVMAILNIVFGSLGLLCNLCGAAQLVMNIASANRVGPGGGPDPSAQLWKAMTEEIPAYVPVQIGNLLVSLLLSAVLLASGIGLLKMQKWARVAAISYAVFDILLRIGALAYHFAFVSPVMSRALNRVMQGQFRQANTPTPDMGFLWNLINVLTVGIVAIFIIYDAVLLITMLLPAVGRAFAQQPLDEEEERFDEEGDDFERERRRREKWSE